MPLNTADLHPVFRPVADRVLEQTQGRLNTEFPGSVIHPDSLWRSPAMQEAVKLTGASGLSLGFHNFGLAMDVAIVDEKGVYVADGEDPRYTVFGEVAKANGCAWGGDWAKKDWDHCEFCGGVTVHEFLAWLASHPVPS